MLPLFKILLVDDDADDRYLISEAFELTGCNVQINEAESGIDALQILGAMQPLPSLVVVDMNMPGMGGIETIEQIRKLGPEIPVVLLTTSLTSELASNAISTGANGCFNKPIPFEDMCSLANQLCRRFIQR
nr:response regulator [uncultured Dyadobacter sp.]